MSRTILLVFFVLFAGMAISVSAQNQLDGRPLNPDIDPDIDMFMGSWQNSIPFNTHGSLVERAILTPLRGDDHLRPQRKAAVMRNINRFSRASLDPNASTTPVTLDGEQEILYFTAGKGTITAGGETVDVFDGILILMPEGLKFTIANTEDEQMEIYIVSEPVTDGFMPNKTMTVMNEKLMPYRDAGIPKTHWAHNGKSIFTKQKGLSTISAITLITFNAMTIGHPHSHGEDYEEIWTVIEGKGIAFLGKEIRWQPPGTAYKIPQTDFTPHSNINVTEKPVKYLYIAVTQ
ncbi:cupin domain-containing protein [Candidatus Latescibacterota bacterium]